MPPLRSPSPRENHEIPTVPSRRASWPFLRGSVTLRRDYLIGVTQPDDDVDGAVGVMLADALVGVMLVDVLAGVTQSCGADAVAIGVAVDADCNFASSCGDGLPSGGKPFACSKFAIASRVLVPIVPSALPFRYPSLIN